MTDKICLISEEQLAREANLPRKVLHDHTTKQGEVIEGVLERLERLGYIRVLEKNMRGTELCKVLVYEKPWDHRIPTRNFSTDQKRKRRKKRR